ncbi:MAG: hypothetical protein PVG66_00875 [Chromatiales bacterium]|jgi:hypothetical protein
MLVFVYNADSGRINAWLDTAHKILSPSTYDCRLCQLTYGLVQEKTAWKQFRQQYPGQIRFLHKDEFEQQYGQKMSYPVVLRDDDGALQVLLSREDFSRIDNLQQLIDQLDTRLKQ